MRLIIKGILVIEIAEGRLVVLADEKPFDCYRWYCIQSACTTHFDITTHLTWFFLKGILLFCI